MVSPGRRAEGQGGLVRFGPGRSSLAQPHHDRPAISSHAGRSRSSASTALMGTALVLSSNSPSETRARGYPTGAFLVPSRVARVWRRHQRRGGATPWFACWLLPGEGVLHGPSDVNSPPPHPLTREGKRDEAEKHPPPFEAKPRRLTPGVCVDRRQAVECCHGVERASCGAGGDG